VKGIIFNLAEAVVGQVYGEDTWDAILDRAGLDGAWTSLGSYPDEELMRVVGAAAELRKADPNDVVRSIAQGAIPLLAERYPHFFTPHGDARSFVLTLNDIIHPEVRKLYPGADVPNFTHELVGDTGLRMGYQSTRKLCTLAEGFVLGAAVHYGQSAMIEQSACMLRGDEKCVLDVEFSRAVG
jgi:hypothetical protein